MKSNKFFWGYKCIDGIYCKFVVVVFWNLVVKGSNLFINWINLFFLIFGDCNIFFLIFIFLSLCYLLYLYFDVGSCIEKINKLFEKFFFVLRFILFFFRLKCWFCGRKIKILLYFLWILEYNYKYVLNLVEIKSINSFDFFLCWSFL